MNYTVSEITDGVAKITLSDDSFIYIDLDENMTEADLDDAVFRAYPANLKTGSAPSFLSEGAERTAAAVTASETRPDWQIARQNAYGGMAEQIEFITENGLEAWQTRVAEIKTANPKS